MQDKKDQQQLRQEVRAFLAEQLAAGAFTPACDSWHTGVSREFSKELGRRGWIGLALPEEVGGGGRTFAERFAVVEELLAAGAPVGGHWIAERQIAPAIAKLGTDEQKQTFLPPIIRGEMFFGLGMSEPDSGSDLASVRTRARPVEGGWQLSGQKVWTSVGMYADYFIVLCRTADAENKHAGLSQLLVDRSSPGVDVRPIATITGEGNFCEVFFNDVFVPDERLLGVEGDGWRQITSELAYERGGPERYLSAFPLFTAFLAALEEPVDDATVRAIGELTATFGALRSLGEQVIAAMDSGAQFATDAALLKDAGTKFEQQLVQTLRSCGRSEFENEPVVAELAREATLASPTFTLRGGTTEVLRGIISKELRS